MFPRLPTQGKHRGKQCFRNNVSTFAQALMFVICFLCVHMNHKPSRNNAFTVPPKWNLTIFSSFEHGTSERGSGKFRVLLESFAGISRGFQAWFSRTCQQTEHVFRNLWKSCYCSYYKLDRKRKCSEIILLMTDDIQTLRSALTHQLLFVKIAPIILSNLLLSIKTSLSLLEKCEAKLIDAVWRINFV